MYSSLPRNRSFKNRGIKKAPFVVLIGAQMPSVLAEIAFLSNPRDESLLKKPEYRQKVAEALFRGVSQYADALSHLQVARQRLQAAPVQ
jgi:N-acetylmuramoyl-L-alanine amidase